MAWVLWSFSHDFDEQIKRHLTAAFWGSVLTLLAYVVIMMDTRDRNQGAGTSLRDRILGVEQRYFVAILNGLLLYFSLLVLLKPAPL